MNFGRRWRLEFQPRDMWVGVYIARSDIYVCLVPMLVIRWRRL